MKWFTIELCTLFYYLTVKMAFAEVSMDFIHRRQVQILVDMMKTISSMNKFDNIIFYRTPDEVYEDPLDKSHLLANNSELHKSVGDIIAEYMNASGLDKPVMTFSISPWDYVNDTENIPNLGKMLTNRNLAVVVLNDIFNTEVKEFVSTSLGASLDTKLIFLLIGHELTGVMSFIRLEKLKRFFRWCWSKNMLNVVLMFQQDHIQSDVSELFLEAYTYTPFPKPIQIIQLTNEHPSTYYVDRTSNLMGYEFKTPVFNDKPSVFKVNLKFPHKNRSVDVYNSIVSLRPKELTEILKKLPAFLAICMWNL